MPLLYGPLPDGPIRILGPSDSAFKREKDCGHAMRGCLILFAPAADSTDINMMPVHVLDYVARKQRHVTRSTFVAELYASTDAADQLWMAGLTVHEVERGPVSAEIAVNLRNQGGLSIDLILALDAMSVCAATSAEHLRQPAEKNLYVHVLWLRELLDRGVVSQLMWTDMRCMCADGLTKGSIDRED